MAVARAGEEATPVLPSPPQLRPFLQFSKLPARAVDATRRAVDSDEEFRSRVAEVVSEGDVGRAGWLWLTRPQGWESDLDRLQREAADAGEAAADRRAENEARRRLAGAEAATERAEAAAAAAQAESSRAAAALAEERRARRAATQESEDLGRRLRQATTERDRARAERDRAAEDADHARGRASDLRAELDDLRARLAATVDAAAAPPPPPAQGPGGPGGVGGAADEVAKAAGSALLGAASAAARMASALEEAAAALGARPAGATPEGDPSPDPSPAPAPRPGRTVARERRPRPARRAPVPLPPGVLDDSVEAADHLVRAPGMTLLVDGYNVSQSGWPDLAIAEQRRRLVDALTELAARTGVDVSVVFDGADPLWPPVVPATSRLVRVSFSPAEVEADDVVLGRVAEMDVNRPVLVASSDRRVRDGAAGMGANVISSAQLLAALRR